MIIKLKQLQSEAKKDNTICFRFMEQNYFTLYLFKMGLDCFTVNDLDMLKLTINLQAVMGPKLGS